MTDIAPPQSAFTTMTDRHAGMVDACCSVDYSMKAISEASGVYYARTSRAVRRAEVPGCKA